MNHSANLIPAPALKPEPRKMAIYATTVPATPPTTAMRNWNPAGYSFGPIGEGPVQ